MNPKPDLAIRMARAAFNRALAEGDLAAIGPILAPDAMLVTGTDSALIAGRKAQLLAWKREFAARERAIYTRTPESITASPVAPMAFEHGHWHAVSTSGQRTIASGAYTAKWREIGGAWMIEAELFLTLA